ncbi:MAG TPA: iron ABC transporter permease [Isosphaeraceae bacterium]|nr:iron ABC transporter permease [Isosphaeraceae bacterium]
MDTPRRVQAGHRPDEGVSTAVGGARPARGDEIRRPPSGLVTLVLGILLLAAILLGTTFGSVALPPLALVEIPLNRLGLAHLTPTWTPQDEAILLDLRLPRVIGAALVGLALAATGTLFQGLLRNPLADPYVIGTSGGAALGAVIGLILAGPVMILGFGAVPLAAFVGALGATALVYRLARVGRRTPAVTLLLAGIAVSTVLTYLVSLLLILNDRLMLNLPRLYGWLLGGVAVSAWIQLAVVGPVILLVTVVSFGLTRSLNAFGLGEEAAERLGIPVERDKLLIIAAGSLLTGAAVTISGLIGFVGLIVPHAMRLIAGPDHRRLLPYSALAGASFLVVADLLARTILAPVELPVGILTAFIGGPYFLYLLRASRREYAL